jgi:hypothetical protein
VKRTNYAEKGIKKQIKAHFRYEERHFFDKKARKIWIVVKRLCNFENSKYF